MPASCRRPDATTELMRARCLNTDRQQVLLSMISGSAQEADLSVAPNCAGLGRIRHFRAEYDGGPFPPNPLPIVPAAQWLGLRPTGSAIAQVFQIAGCAWRCWYCYVPFNMLAGDPKRARWLDAREMVNLYAAEPDRPAILDLSGGSPDIAPEWIAWTLDAIAERGLSEGTYVWSDDNLSSDLLLRPEMRTVLNRVAGRRGYGRACCLKGYDAGSFSFNTGAAPEGWERQLEILAGYARAGIDVYGYVTLTGPPGAQARDAVLRLLDRLQAMDPTLPLRVVPLRVTEFSTMTSRLDPARRGAMVEQDAAALAWTVGLREMGVRPMWEELVE